MEYFCIWSERERLTLITSAVNVTVRPNVFDSTTNIYAIYLLPQSHYKPNPYYKKGSHNFNQSYHGAPNFKRDAWRVFEVLKAGGAALPPADIGYFLATGASQGLEKISKGKKRSAHKRNPTIGTLELEKEPHVNGAISRLDRQDGYARFKLAFNRRCKVWCESPSSKKPGWGQIGGQHF